MQSITMVGIKRKTDKRLKFSSAQNEPLSELDFIQRHPDLYHGLKAAGLKHSDHALKFKVRQL